MDTDSVRTYVEQSKAVFESSPQIDEANTKAAVLRDFLELLDWQIPENTQLEYSVEAFGNTYKVDYALILDGTPVAFIEAKGADTALTTDHEEQLSSYMMNKNVNYGILSNGKEYWFFQRRVDASNVDVQKVGDVKLEDIPNRLAVLRAYTKGAIESGESGKILGRINELRQARQTLQADKDELSTDLAILLSNQVSDTISSLAESQAKEMIDRLVEDIDSEIDADNGSRTGGVSGRDEGRSTKISSDDKRIEASENQIVGKIKRGDIDGDDGAKVAVFPTRKSGLPFLKENNGWGFVRVASEFDFVAMYVTGDVGEVKYFAKVKDAVPAHEADLARPIMEYADGAKIAEDKVVIRFEPDSLFELEDPIPFESKYPQSLQYTTLQSLRRAETTDDLF